MLVTAVAQPKTPPRVLHMRSLLVLERLKTTIDNVNNLVDVARWEYHFQPKQFQQVLRHSQLLQDLVYNLQLRHNARNAIARNTAHQLVTDRCRGKLYDTVHTVAHVTRQIAIDLYTTPDHDSTESQARRQQLAEANKVLELAEGAWNEALREVRKGATRHAALRSRSPAAPIPPAHPLICSPTKFHRAWTAEDTTRSYQGGPPSLSLNSPVSQSFSLGMTSREGTVGERSRVRRQQQQPRPTHQITDASRSPTARPAFTNSTILPTLQLDLKWPTNPPAKPTPLQFYEQILLIQTFDRMAAAFLSQELSDLHGQTIGNGRTTMAGAGSRVDGIPNHGGISNRGEFGNGNAKRGRDEVIRSSRPPVLFRASSSVEYESTNEYTMARGRSLLAGAHLNSQLDGRFDGQINRGGSSVSSRPRPASLQAGPTSGDGDHNKCRSKEEETTASSWRGCLHAWCAELFPGAFVQPLVASFPEPSNRFILFAR